MRLRHACLFVCLAAVGCHGLGRPSPEKAPDRSGQIPAADPQRTTNHLGLAAGYLEAGNPAAACQHLGHHLQDHPDQTVVRGQFADLLMRLGRGAEARTEFEHFLNDAAERNDIEIRRRVHAHGRLMQLAEQQDDAYASRLHRGIGLYLLACGRAKLDEPEGELPVEGLLCKAAGELTLARDLEPEELRPCWYLYLVWHRLGQQHLAEGWLQRAAAGAQPSWLPAAELRSLHLALEHHAARKRTW